MEQNGYDRAMQMNVAAREYMQKGDLQSALENLVAALQLLPEDVDSKARLHNNKGHIEVRLKAYDDALSSFQKAARIYDKLGEQILLGEQFGNIGSVYRDMEQWDAALENYSKSLAVFEEAGHHTGIADQYSNIGYAHFRQGRLESALQFLQAAKGLYDGIGEEKKAQLCDQNIEALKSFLEK